MDQYQLVAILIVGIRNLPATTWINSFKNVNLHPKHRISFKEWCSKIHQYLKTGEAAYARTNRGMFDAMPGFWKNLDIETRQKLMQRISSMYEQAGSDDNVWQNKTNLLRLAELVPLKLIPALRVCHQVAKSNPDVIVGSIDANKDNTEDEVVIEEKKAANVPLQTFMLLPPNLVKAKREAVTETERICANLDLYKHVISFRNRMNHEQEKQEVSAYLNVEYSKEQQRLLNPTVLDTITGFIIKDSQGDGAKRRLPQRRLNMVDAEISSHCCILHSKERLELIRRSNEVAAIMGEIETDRIRIKEANKKKREADEAAKAA